MGAEKDYFTLSLDTLRSLGGWAADCAERALPLFEQHAPADFRPRAAIEGIRAFAAGGRRTAQLRTLALAPPVSPHPRPTPTPWPTSSKPNTSWARRPMPRWRSNWSAAIRLPRRTRFNGRSSRPPPKCARCCCKCPPVHRAGPAWISSCTGWMKASAPRARHARPDA